MATKLFKYFALSLCYPLTHSLNLTTNVVEIVIYLESFKNISLFESEGAFSLWSRLMYCPLEKAATKNPPPPRLPLLEEVTAKAKPTATAASIALPPFFRMEIPASDACLLLPASAALLALQKKNTHHFLISNRPSIVRLYKGNF